jgi:uncharacterized membrane protein
MTRSHLATVVCFAISTAALAHPPPPPRHYSITPLPIDGYDGISIRDMNSLGHVVGIRTKWQGLPSAIRYGFYWSPTTGMIDLGESVTPMSINNNDVAVGNVYRPTGCTPFRWSPGQGIQTILGVPKGGTIFAQDINDAGQILSTQSAAGSRGFVLNPDGTVRFLPTPDYTRFTTVTTIDPAGSALGWVQLDIEGRSPTYATRWPAAGGFQNLGDLPGGNVLSFAGEMDGGGIIIGSGSVDPGTNSNGQRAVYWDSNLSIHQIGVLPGFTDSSADHINHRGEVVGWVGGRPDFVHAHAFLWTQDEGQQDLNQFIDNPDGHWLLTMPGAITDSGVIATNALYDEHESAVILTPDGQVPEPAVAMVLCMANACLRRGRRRGVRTNDW